jgi:hypothetical protein
MRRPKICSTRRNRISIPQPPFLKEYLRSKAKLQTKVSVLLYGLLGHYQEETMIKVKAILALASCSAAILCTNSAAHSFKFVEKDADGTKHIRAPFVHVDVHPKTDGQNDVHVKAPFVKVNNPAGPHNSQVSAPFTKVHDNPVGDTKVSAPFTRVHDKPNGDTTVSAPFTKVNSPTAKDKAQTTKVQTNGPRNNTTVKPLAKPNM